MIEIIFEGSEDQRSEMKKIAEDSGLSVRIFEEDGLDGAEVVRLTLEYGPDVLKLLTALAVFIDACIKTGRTYKMSVKGKARGDKRASDT